MDDLIKALEAALQNENWYGALFVALTVPDICGYLETLKESISGRYKRWFKKYMPLYASYVGGESTRKIFLSPSDCYALRCALIHQGGEVVKEQKARETLERFHFTEPSPNIQIHCIVINDNILQLQVDIFCRDVLNGFKKWCQDTQNTPDIKHRIDIALKVYPLKQIPGISIGD
jgi:hypothetical protein